MANVEGIVQGDRPHVLHVTLDDGKRYRISKDDPGELKVGVSVAVFRKDGMTFLVNKELHLMILAKQLD